MREASAFAPGHITGFFQICDEPDDPLHKGARGSGVSIERGVHTRVRVEPSEQNISIISINGEVTNHAFVSENVLRRMLNFQEQPYRIKVDHDIHIPVGAGFSSSGCGALTLALALNEALGLGMSTVEAAQVAHVAEIECRTGLGSVFAALNGGFGVLVKPGGPGVGEALRYDRCDELSIVHLHFGPIPTKKALENEALRRRINELGGRFVDELRLDLEPARFMELSRRFTEHLDIATLKVRAILKKADKKEIPCTMAMFGETLFSLITDDEVERVAGFLSNIAPNYDVKIVKIDDQGARMT